MNIIKKLLHRHEWKYVDRKSGFPGTRECTICGKYQWLIGSMNVGKH